MINFILYHSGTNSLPKHINFCLKQIIKYNPTSKIYFITDLNINFNVPHIEVINVNNLWVPNIGNYYINDAYSTLWRTSALRLFYIESLMEQRNIQNVIHFDNDVMIYKDFSLLENRLLNFDCAITSHFKSQFVFGFSFIKKANSLTKINQKLLELMLLGEHKLKSIITDCMPHEMRLLGYINEQYSLFDSLPILPEGEGSDNFDVMQVCFDPSSYGQYLGGREPEENHLIGKALINKTIEIKFDKIPLGTFNKKFFSICNLHVHSKQLEKFL